MQSIIDKIQACFNVDMSHQHLVQAQTRGQKNKINAAAQFLLQQEPRTNLFLLVTNSIFVVGQAKYQYTK